MSVKAIATPLVNNVISLEFSRPNDREAPATTIMGSAQSSESQVLKEKLVFCYRAAVRALESCRMKKYSDFDGLTTSNCCHGMAVFACDVVRSVLQLDLKAIQEEGEQRIQELEKNRAKNQDCKWTLRVPVVHLTCLYILGFIRENDPVKGGRTVERKLQAFASVTKTFCRHVVQSLQKEYSNLIANSYAYYAQKIQEINPRMYISGAPLKMWAKYVNSEYVRVDKRGIKYASNLFSMQVSLAYLIQSESKIALINDILDSSGHLEDRYVCLFEGDGNEGLRPLSYQEIKLLQAFNQDEPIVVFGGCVNSDSLHKEGIALHMKPWLDRFPNLMLGCDAIYPQFIQIGNDPFFDSTPISPNEKLLTEIIDDHLKIKGVSAFDSSLYCAAHIYPASLKQVLAIWSGENEMELPISFLPQVIPNK